MCFGAILATSSRLLRVTGGLIQLLKIRMVLDVFRLDMYWRLNQLRQTDIPTHTCCLREHRDVMRLAHSRFNFGRAGVSKRPHSYPPECHASSTSHKCCWGTTSLRRSLRDSSSHVLVPRLSVLFRKRVRAMSYSRNSFCNCVRSSSVIRPPWRSTCFFIFQRSSWVLRTCLSRSFQPPPILVAMSAHSRSFGHERAGSSV